MVCAVHAQRVVVVVHRDVGMTAERLFDGNRHPAAAGKEVDDQLILHAEQKLLMGTISHRSEEHTSELQSLMRHSYAVFCLKTNRKHAHRNSLHKCYTPSSSYAI